MLFTTDTNNTFDPKGCDKADLDSDVTLDKVNVHWTYKKGDDFIEMGYMNVEMLRETILSGFKRFKTDKLTFEEFKSFWSLSMDEDENQGPGPKVAFEKLLKSVDKTDYLTKEDLKKIPRDALKELARVMDPPHGPKKEKELLDNDLDIRKSMYDYNESEDEEDKEKKHRIEL